MPDCAFDANVELGLQIAVAAGACLATAGLVIGGGIEGLPVDRGRAHG